MQRYFKFNTKKILLSLILILGLIVITNFIFIPNIKHTKLKNEVIDATKKYLEVNKIDLGENESYTAFLPILSVKGYLDIDEECLAYSYVEVTDDEYETNIICGEPSKKQLEAFEEFITNISITPFSDPNIIDDLKTQTIFTVRGNDTNSLVPTNADIVEALVIFDADMSVDFTFEYISYDLGSVWDEQSEVWTEINNNIINNEEIENNKWFTINIGGKQAVYKTFTENATDRIRAYDNTKFTSFLACTEADQYGTLCGKVPVVVDQIDRTLPTISYEITDINNQEIDPYYEDWYTSYLKLKITCEDVKDNDNHPKDIISNIASCEYKLVDKNTTDEESEESEEGWTNIDQTLDVLDGNFYYKVRTIDKAGNKTFTDINLKVDTIEPKISVNRIDNGTICKSLDNNGEANIDGITWCNGPIELEYVVDQIGPSGIKTLSFLVFTNLTDEYAYFDQDDLIIEGTKKYIPITINEEGSYTYQASLRNGTNSTANAPIDIEIKPYRIVASGPEIDITNTCDSYDDLCIVNVNDGTYNEEDYIATATGKFNIPVESITSSGTVDTAISGYHPVKYTATDTLGNKNEVIIYYNVNKNIENPTVTYDAGYPLNGKQIHNKNINVTINATNNQTFEPLTDWSLNEDNKSLTKLFKQTYEGIVTVKDTDNNLFNILINVDIDKTKPTSEVIGDLETPTNEKLTITIRTNKKVTITSNKLTSNWPSVVGKYNPVIDRWEYKLDYEAPFIEILTLTDIYGNYVKESLSVQNVDISDFTIEEPTCNPTNDKGITNKEITCTIKFSKPIDAQKFNLTEDNKCDYADECTLTSNAKILKLIYKEDTDGIDETFEFISLYTDKISVPIKTIAIDTKKPEVIATTINLGDKVEVTLTSDEPLQKPTGYKEIIGSNGLKWTKNYTENFDDDIIVKDIAGNEFTIRIKVKILDASNLINKITKSSSLPILTNEPVKVTLELNRPLASSVETTMVTTCESNDKQDCGWQKINDTKYTKEYKKQVSVSFTISDQDDQEATVEFEIDNIDMTKINVISLDYDGETLTNKPIEVTITVNKELVNTDLELHNYSVEDNVWIYKINVTGNQNIVLRDLYGNTKQINIDIDNYDSRDLIISPESYFWDTPTKDDVVVSFVTNKELNLVRSISGSSAEIIHTSTIEDTYTYIVTYSNNGTYTMTLYDLWGNSTTMPVSITGIDQKALTAQIVEVTPTTPTKGNVIVTVETNKEIITDGWKKVVSSNPDTFRYEYEFTNNITDKITLTDMVGWQANINVDIQNIDKNPLTAQIIEVTPTTPTKGIVTVTVETNKEIINNDWTKIYESDTTFRYTRDFDTNIAKTITLSDIAGWQANIDINIQNIDKKALTAQIVKISPTSSTKGNVTVTVETNKEIITDGWVKIFSLNPDAFRYEYEFTDNITDTITLTDKAGWQVNIDVNIQNIDRIKPILSNLQYSQTLPTDQDVVVTIDVSEAPSSISGTGWIYDVITKTIFKTFELNYTETVKVIDNAGNESNEILVEVNNIDKEDLTAVATYNPSSLTNTDVTATITTNKEIVTPAGWTKVDATHYTLTYSKNITQEIVVSTLNAPYKNADVRIDINNIDKELPKININSINPINWSTTKAIISMTLNDSATSDYAASGVEAYAITTDILEPSSWNTIAKTNSYELDYTVNVNGTYYVWVKDATGNISSPELVTINKIDSILPEVNITSTNPISWTNQDVVINAILTDNETSDYAASGIIAYAVTTNGTINPVSWTPVTKTNSYNLEYLASGNGTYYVWAKDEAGNISIPKSIAINKIDKTNPNVGNITSSNTDLTNQNIEISTLLTDSLSGIIAYAVTTTSTIPTNWTTITNTNSYDLNYEITTNGTYYVWAKDSAGNISLSKNIQISNIDKGIPELGEPVYSPSGPTNTSVKVTITASKSIVSVSLSDWELSANNTVLTKIFDNNKSETITVTDAFGNVSNSKLISVQNIDKIAPTLTEPTYSTLLPTKGNVTVTLTSNEPMQSLSGWTLSNNDKTLTKTYLNNIDENITFKDIAGNPAIINIKINNIDKTAPTINITDGGADINLYYGDSFNVENYPASATDNYDTSVNVSKTNNVNTSVVGEYYIKYSATDTAGNTSEIIRKVFVNAASSTTLLRSKCNWNDSNGGCYIQGNNSKNDNFIWYSGQLWRAYKVNNDGTIKLVTEDAVSSFSYGQNNYFGDANNYVSTWLNNNYWNSLNSDNKSSTIETVTYCISRHSAEPKHANEDLSFADAYRGCANDSKQPSNKSYKVALLTIDEYTLVGGASSYLNTGDAFYTQTGANEAGGWLWGVKSNGHTMYNYDPKENNLAIRPVITLKNNVTINGGNGSKTNPYRITNDLSASSNTYLNTRKNIGEYVTFGQDNNNKIWRIQNVNGLTTLILNDFYKPNGSYYTAAYGNNNFNVTNTNDIGYKLNNTIKTGLFNSTQQNYLSDTSTYYVTGYALGANPKTTSLQNTGTLSGKALIGLPRFGDILSARPKTLNTKPSNDIASWTLTYNSSNSSEAWIINMYGAGLNYPKTATQKVGVMPVIILKSDVKIASGNGTPSNPYTLTR